MGVTIVDGNPPRSAFLAKNVVPMGCLSIALRRGATLAFVAVGITPRFRKALEFRFAALPAYPDQDVPFLPRMAFRFARPPGDIVRRQMYRCFDGVYLYLCFVGCIRPGVVTSAELAPDGLAKTSKTAHPTCHQGLHRAQGRLRIANALAGRGVRVMRQNPHSLRDRRDRQPRWRVMLPGRRRGGGSHVNCHRRCMRSTFHPVGVGRAR